MSDAEKFHAAIRRQTTVSQPSTSRSESAEPRQRIRTICANCGSSVYVTTEATAPAGLDVERLGQLISDALEYTNDGLVIAKAVAVRLRQGPPDGD